MNNLIPDIVLAHSTFGEKIKALSAIAGKLPVVIIIHNLKTQSVEYMSPNGLQILGFSLEQIKALGPAYHERFFNKEDLADYAPKYLRCLKVQITIKWRAIFSRCALHLIMTGSGT